VQCIAGQGRKTRGYIQTACITDSRALIAGEIYLPNECKGGAFNQAEAIAQARTVAQLNAAGVYGDSGTGGKITPNLQWETVIPKGRLDLLLYDRTKSTGDIGIVEIKGSWNGGARRASADLTRYIKNNPQLGSHSVIRSFGMTLGLKVSRTRSTWITAVPIISVS
jgi:hypothetical protein